MKMEMIEMRRMDLRNGGALVRILGEKRGEGEHGSVVDAVDVVGDCLLLFLLPFSLHPPEFELPPTPADSTRTSELAD